MSRVDDILKARQDLAYARELVHSQRRMVEQLKWEGADKKGAERALIGTNSHKRHSRVC